MAGKSIWAIGDIHGMLDPLRSLVNCIRSIEYQRALDVTLVFLGDYIDHGPSSREVVDLLLELQETGEFEVIFLAGNHEDLMLQFMYGSDLFNEYGNLWFNGNGGADTVCSFMPSREIFQKLYDGTDAFSPFRPEDFVLAPRYRAFFENLFYAHTEELKGPESVLKLAFTHASLQGTGARPLPAESGCPEPSPAVAEQLCLRTYREFHRLRRENGIWLEDMHIWNREYPRRKFADYVLVHGHTPTVMAEDIYGDIGAYDVESGLPFFIFSRPDVAVHRREDRLEFEAALAEVISVNIDTGLAYGKALTAINFNEEQLASGGGLGVLQTHLGRVHRDRDDLECFEVIFRRGLY